ncbi:MAG: hypothetical protein RIB71_13445 [Imperialibacter sp.]|uniref:hypothetical protein n=1 Tax=Imperialibacter sp. TaxID=2038411 RepID=UPI0032EE6785
MDKLTRYNQKLLAILGTIVFVGISLFVLIGGVTLTLEIVNNFKSNEIENNALRVEPKSDTTDQTGFIREQNISMGRPTLVDTLNSIYLFGVSQVNLRDPELADYHDMAKESFRSSKLNVSYEYPSRFNNIIVYRQKTNTKSLVFNEKVGILRFEARMIGDEQFVLVEGTMADSNNDGKLTASDLTSFFSYRLSDGKLSEVSYSAMGLVDYYLTNESCEVILRFAKDKDGNGEIDRNQEPIYLTQFDLCTNDTSDFLDEGMIRTLQHIID